MQNAVYVCTMIYVVLYKVIFHYQEITRRGWKRICLFSIEIDKFWMVNAVSD